MRKIVLFFFFSVLCLVACAQDVEFISLEAAQGRGFMACLSQGETTDTLLRGTVPASGKIAFSLPEKYRGSVCAVRFVLQQAGAWTFIKEKNKLTVNFADGKIVCTGSTENALLMNASLRQEEIQQKVNVIYGALSLFADNAALVSELKKEFSAQNNAYQTLRRELENSTSYAADYLLVQQMLLGYADRIYMPEEQQKQRAALLAFAENRLNIDHLYTNGLWENCISTLALTIADSPQQFARLMIKKLAQTKSDEIFNYFANYLIINVQRMGWNDAEEMLATYLATSPRVKNGSWVQRRSQDVAKTAIGTQAPAIEGVDNLKNVLLVFFESDCHNCQREIDALIRNYPKIQQKGFRVISIAADREKTAYERFVASCPWRDKICDLQGFDSPFFRNYGINGTPVLLLTDGKGKIAAKFARWEEIGW